LQNAKPAAGLASIFIIAAIFFFIRQGKQG